MPRALYLAFALVVLGTLSGCFEDGTPAADAGVDADAQTRDIDTGPDASPTPDIGDPCSSPQQCGEGASCIGTADSTASFICMKNCPEPGRICEDGSVCIRRFSGDASICYTGGDTPRGDTCENNLDCVSGTLCFGTETEHYCLEACHELDPNACPEGTFCKTGSTSSRGYCRSTLGASCATTEECDAELVCTEEIDGLAGRFRAGQCTVDDCNSDSDCPDDGVCRQVPDTEHSICLTRCESHGDCRFNQDYRCLSDSYCNQTDRAAECEAFRDGADVCFPVSLLSQGS